MSIMIPSLVVSLCAEIKESASEEIVLYGQFGGHAGVGHTSQFVASKHAERVVDKVFNANQFGRRDLLKTLQS